MAVPTLFLSACGDDDSAATCGDGGVVGDGGRCVAEDGGTGTPTGTPMKDSGTKPPPGSELSCGKDTVEKNGECIAKPADDAGTTPPVAVQGPVGSGCETDDDCADGTTCLIDATLPGGSCTVIGCSMENPCPVGSTCYHVTKGLDICMAYCDGSTECRKDEGYNCQPLFTNAINICAPPCTLTNACPSGTDCNADNGLCELSGCDPKAKKNKCKDDETCWPDTEGLTSQGGLCLRLCDPNDPKATCLVDQKDEVCQPLAADPKNTGFCAPPVCSKTAECPAGAICQDRVCQPPALCDKKGKCSDRATTCVAGACMPKCPDGGDTCGDIHPGLICADALDTPACLPVGSFPGSECRPNRDDACSDLAVGDSSTPMICQDNVCLPDCGEGGDELCAAVSDTLACAVGIYEHDLCLPKGVFPGGPCGAGDSCAQDLQGNPAVDMQCVSGTCVIGCDEADQWPGYGDALCQIVDPSLTCAGAAGNICVHPCDAEGSCATGFSCLDVGAVPAHENACLPNGTFPGSTCADGDVCTDLLTGETQTCVNHVCVVECGTGGDTEANDAICTGVDERLTCAEDVGNICVFACQRGQCLPGFSCLGAGGENACLPDGSFPGSTCSDVVDHECADVGPLHQKCLSADNTCVLDCNTAADAATEDTLCAAINSALTCAEDAGGICVIKCGNAGACPDGYSCLNAGTEDACLPTGTFPGSPCRTTVGDECSDLPTGETQECVNDTCVVDCNGDGDAVADDAICTGVNAALTCAEDVGGICVIKCVSGQCLPGFSCLNPGTEDACLPTGSFPGSPCRETVGDECDDLSAQVSQKCEKGICAIDCNTLGTAANDDSFCAAVGAGLPVPETLTCSETLQDICVVKCGVNGACPTGYSCLNPGTENACLPNGTFPGSTCATGNTCANVGQLSQKCVPGANICAIDCSPGADAGQDDAICAGVNAALTCAELAGNICVLACNAGVCPTGYSCQNPTGENACLPNGSFPGSTCATGNTCANLTLVLGMDQKCVANTCVLDCSPGADAAADDAKCTAVSAALTCSETAGSVCVGACQGGQCLAGYTCTGGAENACLPTPPI